MPNDGYKFKDPNGKITAILDPNGKLTLKDGLSSIEVFDNWRDFVKSMGDAPVKAAQYDEPQVLEQLGDSMGLGQYQPIIRNQEGTTPMAKTTATKTAAKAPAPAKTPVPAKSAPAAKAPAPKKAPAEDAPLKPCGCGCGEQVKREFKQGHDARVHGWAKKIERGEMKMGEIPAIAQKWMKDHGVKQGAPSAPKSKPAKVGK